ncbi:MAG: FAD-dependent oxidoreductase [Desulfosarcinaceae bacterium]|nr:FAD-dependent oxidoreductase [Desulfosarcinaceae bacterium]
MRIAIVGGGVAGIVAAHLLQRKFHVSLFEKNDYVGGHTHTIVVPSGPDTGTPVDTGFIVLNDRTYPILNRFFDALDVTLRKSDMSFSFYDENTGLQYASSNLNTLFAQRRNLLDPGHWLMLAEILRFNRRVLTGLDGGWLDALTLGDFLMRYRFSDRLRDRYLYPLVAAIWSAPDLEVAQFPMLTFARFFSNHGLLSIFRHPQWYFVAGGSHAYVDAFRSRFRGDVFTEVPIVEIIRTQAGVVLRDEAGEQHAFDRVVVATHADEALRLLNDPSEAERRLLGAWRYSVNETILHTDLRWMPPSQRAWASWNVIRGRGAVVEAPVTLTYHMNRLQQLDTRRQYLVTLNPFRPIDPDHIIARMIYTHPIYDFESLNTQTDLPNLNGVRNTFFCGSYFGYGFHEDAARSGAQAAVAMGVSDEF